MKPQRFKKTLCETTTQSFLKSARIVDGQLWVQDRRGASYRAQRTPCGAGLLLTDAVSGWSGRLVLDAWSAAELAWWEHELDAASAGAVIWVLVEGPDSVVVGHAVRRDLAARPEDAHPFRVGNAAGRRLPALGERYVPPPPPVRPRRTRGGGGAGA
jgi:hypothetical protein